MWGKMRRSCSVFFFFSSRRRHTRFDCDWSSDVCSSDLGIRYLDVGTSGGVLGFEHGYCLMIGGEPEAVALLEPALATLAPGGRLPSPPAGNAATRPPRGPAARAAAGAPRHPHRRAQRARPLPRKGHNRTEDRPVGAVPQG